jgi:hypothetical protein
MKSCAFFCDFPQRYKLKIKTNYDLNTEYQ